MEPERERLLISGSPIRFNPFIADKERETQRAGRRGARPRSHAPERGSLKQGASCNCIERAGWRPNEANRMDELDVYRFFVVARRWERRTGQGECERRRRGSSRPMTGNEDQASASSLTRSAFEAELGCAG